MVCQQAMERSISSIKKTDKIRNTIIRSKPMTADVSRKIAKLKRDWACHMGRMQPDRRPQIISHWVPEFSQYRPGRPRRRRCDDLGTVENWHIIAQDRDHWRNSGKAFAQQWDNIGL